ncbi:MBL fold metallo-hydrolase [Croceivirga thetidis]|uniref:Metallo-beta-lactamase domain-containing protein n=1 Tax=Croceivirga thetidis TaxID=2721623 RepID=A0ABX1GT86_9FLAO|nr:MBL fold metallo-hydrolase [Croceivirga thetidis]NKI33148.1 hypothetical protein [Croceivirga thetidis]
MQLIIFRSSKGDSLLISNPIGDGKNTNILVDGGMKSSFNASVAPYLNKEIQQKGEVVDLLCVSHIDDDHIVGIIALMELLTEWRVYNHHKSNPNSTANVKKPKIVEPPTINSIWHNSFAEAYDLGESLPQIANALQNVEQMTSEHLKNDLFHRVSHKATSIKKGIILSQRIDPDQLNIPLNPEYNGRVVKCNQRTVSKNEHAVGNINLSVIGPFQADLTDLKEKWEKWEKAHAEELKEFFADLSVSAINQPLSLEQLSQLLINSGTLGDRDEVSIPNLASIMFLAEADGSTILMTGDGHSDDILKGLAKNEKLNANGGLHVNVLKVQHHGAEANIDLAFCKKITADHYVFCGNGTHHNPEEAVLEVIYKSRAGEANEKSPNPEVEQPFTFWFNANPKDSLTENQEKHLKKIEKLVKEFKEDHANFHFKFMPKNEHFMVIGV